MNARQKPLNAAQKITGVTLTNFMKGYIHYFALKMKHIPLIRIELTERNVPSDQSMNVTTLKDLLKKDENNSHDHTGKAFKPMAPIVLYEDIFLTQTADA